MRVNLTVTVEMTADQMNAWAAVHGIEATERAIRLSLPGLDLAPLMDGRCGRIAAVGVTAAEALGLQP